MDSADEEWRTVLGYEGLYEVSNLGRVRSLTRTEVGRYGCLRTREGRILVPHVNSRGYRAVSLSKENRKANKRIARLVAKAFHGIDGIVDHANQIKTDDRAVNLREASNSENLANRKAPSNNTSGYKGVYRHKGKWVASIVRHGVSVNLGRFKAPELAAKAYDAKAIELFGEFAGTNFPQERNDG